MIKKFTLLILSTLILKPTVAQAEDCSIKVGVVPQYEQRKIFQIWMPILEALEERTGCQFELIGSGSLIEFEKAVKRGVYDLAYMNPYHVMIAKKAQGYEPIARSGEKQLTGILVVRKDSSIEDIAALDEQEIAFPSPNSLGASLLMRAELAAKQDIYVNPKYVKTHSSVYLHVAKGLTIAGGGVTRTLNEQPDYIKDKLRILYTTNPVNSHPVVMHPRTSKAMQKKVQDAWLGLVETEAGMLENIPMEEPVAASYYDYSCLEELELEEFVWNQE